MTTTTFATWTVSFDAEEQVWDVLDGDGDITESFESQEEAEKTAKENTVGSESEWLYEQIQDRLEQVLAIGGQGGLDALRAMADFVGGVR